MNSGASPLSAEGRESSVAVPQPVRFAARSDAVRLALALAALGGCTVLLGRWLHVSNAAIVSTTYLMVVLVVAATSRLGIAVIPSVVAMLCLNFFFLPPVGTFTIADPQNWVALFAFLAVSLVASNLSAIARAARTRPSGGATSWPACSISVATC